jgi:hypothetical protein
MAIGAEKRRRTPVPSPKEAAAAVRAPDGASHDTEGPEGLLPDYSFTLNYTDKRGRRWTGAFKAHVLKYREKIEVGLIRARMLGALNPTVLDRWTVDLAEMVAHLTVALDAHPAWAEDLTDLYDPAVVNAIYAEVASYEARFLGAAAGGAGAGAGADGGGADDAPLAPKAEEAAA